MHAVARPRRMAAAELGSHHELLAQVVVSTPDSGGPVTVGPTGDPSDDLVV
ncbi:MAG: hypothetical protein M3Z25_21825 [Actinomycetota bacterium]|nr:hypothetical protein [Actinomycetota bacterium]